MLWLGIPILILLVILCYLLFAPVILEINSETGIYRVRIHRVAYAAIRLRESSLTLELNIAGWKKQIDLFARKPKAEKAEKKESAPKKQKKKKSRFSFRKMRAVLRSFRIKECVVIVDTGDMPLNGQLYPLFYFLSRYTGKTFRVSFNDENVIRLQVQNRAARVLWSYIRA